MENLGDQVSCARGPWLSNLLSDQELARVVKLVAVFNAPRSLN
jgi:hypothetical protein